MQSTEISDYVSIELQLRQVILIIVLRKFDFLRWKHWAHLCLCSSLLEGEVWAESSFKNLKFSPSNVHQPKAKVSVFKANENARHRVLNLESGG